MGPHIGGSRLRASSAGDEEVDLLLPGTARYDFLKCLVMVFFFSFFSCWGAVVQVSDGSYAKLSVKSP